MLQRANTKWTEITQLNGEALNMTVSNSIHVSIKPANYFPTTAWLSDFHTYCTASKSCKQRHDMCIRLLQHWRAEGLTFQMCVAAIWWDGRKHGYGACILLAEYRKGLQRLLRFDRQWCWEDFQPAGFSTYTYLLILVYYVTSCRSHNKSETTCCRAKVHWLIDQINI